MRGSVGSCVTLSILVLILENKESHWCFPAITVLGAGDSRKINKNTKKGFSDQISDKKKQLGEGSFYSATVQKSWMATAT